ncbi:MAG: hypothetical protein JSU98_01820 [Gemmatimonadales bacterium]|nr:MAG: hypothetical protein JSU98_01820 [Gemmatimonadales bacterium]
MSDPSSPPVLPRASWPRIGAEALAIVGSILLAFAIDAWWDGLQETARQRSELENLAGDFGQAREELLEKRYFHSLIASSAREAGSRLATAGSEEVVPIPDTLVLAVLSLPTLDIANATLEELEMAADISAIEDPVLRSALVAWPRVVRDVFNEEATSQRLTEGRLIPLLREAADLTPAWERFQGWVDRHARGTPETRVRVAIPTRNSELLRNLLAERTHHEVATVAVLDRSVAHVDSILTLLQR